MGTHMGEVLVKEIDEGEEQGADGVRFTQARDKKNRIIWHR